MDDRMGRADTHVHTSYSGIAAFRTLKFPESVTPPEKQVDCARKNGMDVLCITDHNETAGGFIAQSYARKFDDIEVIVGDEVMTKDGEIIGLFLSEKPKSFLSIEETIDEIREQGGLTIAPHPFSFHVRGLQEKALEIDLDGIEVLNGGHPDAYSNMFSELVAERYPDVWAKISGSDGHSNFTVGFNWTEFEGRTAEEFRRSVLNKTTKAAGVTTPVLGDVQWSMEVVMGGQKLMYRSLRGLLPTVKDNSLVHVINELPDLKKATGIFGGFMYLMPPVPFIATILSTTYLKIGAKKMIAQMDERMKKVDEIMRKYHPESKPRTVGLE